jgi:hypothetical protein
MATTLKYSKGLDNRLRRYITYRNLLNIEYRIKVFPITAQDILNQLNHKEVK